MDEVEGERGKRRNRYIPVPAATSRRCRSIGSILQDGTPGCRRADGARRADRRRGAGRSRVRDRAGPARAARRHASSTSACSRRRPRWASTRSPGRSSIPRAFRELFPDLTDADFPFRGRVGKEAVYLLTADGRLRLPDSPTMHNQRSLRRLAVRDRGLARGQGRGARGERVHRIPGREPARGREPGGGRAHRRERPRPRRETARRIPRPPPTSSRRSRRSPRGRGGCSHRRTSSGSRYRRPTRRSSRSA